MIDRWMKFTERHWPILLIVTWLAVCVVYLFTEVHHPEWDGGCHCVWWGEEK